MGPDLRLTPPFCSTSPCLCEQPRWQLSHVAVPFDRTALATACLASSLDVHAHLVLCCSSSWRSWQVAVSWNLPAAHFLRNRLLLQVP